MFVVETNAHRLHCPTHKRTVVSCFCFCFRWRWGDHNAFPTGAVFSDGPWVRRSTVLSGYRAMFRTIADGKQNNDAKTHP